MLFYVETGVQFTNEYGDIDEVFYSSLEKTYLQALTLMKKENLLGKFVERASKVVRDTRNIGWGFHDELKGIHYDYYSDAVWNEQSFLELLRCYFLSLYKVD